MHLLAATRHMMISLSAVKLFLARHNRNNQRKTKTQRIIICTIEYYGEADDDDVRKVLLSYYLRENI